MVSITETETIAVTPDEFLSFVMDIERYAEVDDKISPVLWSRRVADRVEFACRPTLAGLPQPKVTQFMQLTAGERIDIGLMPLPANRLAHHIARFHASFECSAAEGATVVTRRLQFTFSPAVRWLLEPLFRRRLPAEVREELRRAKAYLEQPPHAAPDRWAAGTNRFSMKGVHEHGGER